MYQLTGGNLVIATMALILVGFFGGTAAYVALTLGAILKELRNGQRHH